MLYVETKCTHPLDELLPVLTDDAPRELDPSKTDVLVHLLHVLVIKRTPAATHLEQQHAQTPKVHRFRVPLVIEEDFRSEVLGRAAERVRQLVSLEVGL